MTIDDATLVRALTEHESDAPSPAAVRQSVRLAVADSERRSIKRRRAVSTAASVLAVAAVLAGLGWVVTRPMPRSDVVSLVETASGKPLTTQDLIGTWTIETISFDQNDPFGAPGEASIEFRADHSVTISRFCTTTTGRLAVSEPWTVVISDMTTSESDCVGRSEGALSESKVDFAFRDLPSQGLLNITPRDADSLVVSGKTVWMVIRKVR